MNPSRLVLFITLALLTGCLPDANSQVEAAQVPGFWLGLWHGIIAPLSFIISLFSSSVGMYEVHNNGAWYDLGFLIGLGLLHGGGAAGHRQTRRRRRSARA
jgi:hypothetical protein